jgi:hypothetical protein
MHTSRLARAARRTVALGALGALALAPAACDSFIEPDPQDVLAPENFYRTASDAIAAVNSIYEQTRWMHHLAYWYMTDVASDDIIASPNFGSDGHRMANYTTDPTEWVFGDVWGNGYRVINRANAVLDRVPAIQMDEALRDRLLGEARFLRAMAYFNLVRFYGDVPLLEHEVKSLAELEVSRSPAAEVYALVESDLTAAAAALPASYAGSGADVGRATSGAAQALLAKVYLTEQKWNEAAATAGDIIQSGEYALLDDFKDVFKVSNELTNPESIFELNYDGVQSVGSVMMLFSLPSGFPGGDAYGLMQVMPSLVAMYAPGDERGNHGSIMIPPYTDAMGRTTTWSVPGGAAFAKWLDETNEQNMTARAWERQPNNWIVLRYADVLLMYAEAVAEGGTPTAGSGLDALNEVRVRAGLPALGALTVDAVRDERRLEFLFEGQRWFDLQRWGILDAAILAKTTEMQTVVPGETTVHGVPSDLWPIPQGELDINPNLTQNPGW